MTKLWLVEEFCPMDNYHCLMPVAYEPVEENGVIQKYRKKEMACRHHQSGKCQQAKNCVFWENAPEELEKNSNWYEP